jgi:ABC-2 type transport system permease protein
VKNARIFFLGGWFSYRALFGWMNPYIAVPLLVVTPIFQVLFFAYMGRAAGLEDDRFFVIGNGLQLAALPALFAMAATIDGERRAQTISSVLATPANRGALFLGRSLPVIANAIVVSLIAFVASALILNVHLAASTYPSLLFLILVTSVSCTGFGLLNAAAGLRIRGGIVLTNMLDAVLLIWCGVNIPLANLPGWMSWTAQGLPLTHSLEAARRVADGASLGSVWSLVTTELLIGLVYATVGFFGLRFFELQSRRHATLGLA